MRADLRIAWLAGLAAAALAPATARAQAGGDVPSPAAVNDPLVASCRLQGTPGSGEACSSTDLACSEPSHLLNLLTYLSPHPRPAPGVAPDGSPLPPATCDTSKAPKDQSLESAFRCFDQEFNAKAMPDCLRVAVLDSPYASVLRPSQRTLAEADIPAAVQRGTLDAHCSAATTLCLDRDGAPIGAGKLLQKGDRLTVIALSVHAVDVGAVSITVAGVRASDSLASRLAVPPGPQKGATPGDVVAYVLAAVISDPIGDDVRTVRVTFRRDDPAHGPPIVPPPLDLPVERGRFYVDFGLALPVVVRGKRVVAAPALVQETTAPRVSFSAIVFPAGRRKDEIRVTGAAAWGIQIGTDFDFTRSVDQKDYYAGIAWEPIAGFGIAAGAALVRGEFIPVGAGPPDLSYIVRPYVGVFLTPDFVSSARAAVNALEAK